MPQPRPAHEVKKREGTFKDKPLHEESFRDTREALLKRNIATSSRPPDRMPDRTGGGVVAGKQNLVEQARDRLDQLGLGGISSVLSDWPTRAQACGADLGGYFNDYKLELSSKYGQPEWIKLMDFMEYSERDGGLAGWLDRWGETMNSPNFDDMAKIADQVEKAVSFNMTMVSEFLQSPVRSGDAALQAQGHELLSLLSSVAAEVSRQTNAVLSNGMKPPKTGARMEAVRETFRRFSEPQARAEEVRKSIQDLNVSEVFNVARGGLDALDERSLQEGLRGWQRGAKDMAYLLEKLRDEPDDSGFTQQDFVSKMRNSFSDIEAGIVAAINKCAGGGRDAELFLRDLRELVDSMYELNRSTSTQLTDDVAQQVLTTLQATLDQNRNKMDAVLDGANPLHADAMRAAQQRKLRDFWSTKRTDLIGQVADKNLKKDLDAVFQEGLGPVLDKWSNANAADKYGLAWQLVATLRNYRGGALSVLDKLGTAGGAQKDYALRLMDAMIAGVMSGL
jgi:AcrR family transcriptional regulator